MDESPVELQGPRNLTEVYRDALQEAAQCLDFGWIDEAQNIMWNALQTQMVDGKPVVVPWGEPEPAVGNSNGRRAD